jgi:hypothetical protein
VAGHGGKRAGAGRPSTLADPVIVPVRFAREDVALIDEQAKQHERTRSEEIRRRALRGLRRG